MGCSESILENDGTGRKREEKGRNKGHIMISYNHAHQKLIIKIKDVLKKHGYNVWIDTENMGPKSNDSMGKAVEKSYVVLVCMSTKYFNSDNCQMEAEYAKDMKKIIIPLKVERDFKANGWLGVITAGKTYYDFTGKFPFNQKMKELLKALNEYYGDDSTEQEYVEADISEDEEFDEEAYYTEYIAYDENSEHLEEEYGGDDNGNVDEVAENNDYNSNDEHNEVEYFGYDNENMDVGAENNVEKNDDEHNEDEVSGDDNGYIGEDADNNAENFNDTTSNNGQDNAEPEMSEYEPDNYDE